MVSQSPDPSTAAFSSGFPVVSGSSEPHTASIAAHTGRTAAGWGGLEQTHVRI